MAEPERLGDFTENISSRFCISFKASTSELLQSLEEMFPVYYVDSDIINRFKSSTLHWCVTQQERVKVTRNIKTTLLLCVIIILKII